MPDPSDTKIDIYVRPDRPDEGVELKYLLIRGKGFIKYEESEKTIWILMVFVKPQFRSKGIARVLISKLLSFGKRTIPGTFTSEGAKYIRRYFSE